MTGPEPDRAALVAVFPIPTDLTKVLAIGQALMDTYRSQALLIGHRVRADGDGHELVIYRAGPSAG